MTAKPMRRQKDDKKPAIKPATYCFYALLMLIVLTTIPVLLLPIPLYVKTFFLGFAIAVTFCISIAHYIFNK